ncbi:alpha/beta fold hydrolase [Niveispirillum fermenti]|uniref:alpha/beta hydrolase n=1 Tax=Niveispirillum fermenti TaxID=1233113 RepID=UPI003A85F991
MSAPIAQTRHFVEIDGRVVHYRRWGQGPAILALHGSPQASRTLVPFAEEMAARGFCVIAPDTPGNGLSTPLSAPLPDSAAYAAALAGFADALGLGRIGLYGFHTGATIACAFAALFPDRVSGVLFDGLPCWTAEERADCLAHYLPPLLPAWDGTHMCWVWSRMEEQVIFFPWHRALPSARMDSDLSTPAHLHANAMDLLEAGDAYRNTYRAAFTFRPDHWLPQVTADHLILVTRSDVLLDHLSRPGLAGVPARTVPDAAALRLAAVDWLAERPGDNAPAAPPATIRGFLDTTSGPLAWRGRLTGSGRPLVLLHRAGGHGGDFDAAIAQAGGPVIAFDLPGHGESTGHPMPDSLAGLATRLAEGIRAAGFNRPLVAGRGIGGLLALHLAADGVADRAVTLGDDPLPDPAQAAPSLAPEWDGAHLVRAFRIARRERLFRPWHDGRQAHAIRPPADLEPADIQRRALCLLKAGPHWTQAVALEAAADVMALRSRVGERHRHLADAVLDGGGTVPGWLPGLLALR